MAEITYMCPLCPAKMKNRYKFTECQLADHVLAFHFATDPNSSQTCPICFRARKDGTYHQNLVVHFYDEH